MTKKVHDTKKKWYPVIAPQLFNEQPLGEVPLYDPEAAVGRIMSVNLMILTDDPKKQNFSMLFRITGAANGQLKTEIVGMVMQQTAVKRMVRRKKIRIDESFPCATKDGKRIRIKPFLVTYSLAKGSVLQSLHKHTLQFLKKEIAKLDFEQVIHDIIIRKLQQEMQAHLKKIYPLAVCEIRQILLKGVATSPDPAAAAETETETESGAGADDAEGEPAADAPVEAPGEQEAEAKPARQKRKKAEPAAEPEAAPELPPEEQPPEAEAEAEEEIPAHNI
ncbi:MAG TPA: hypothetical protein VJC16_02505 [Candidatus Nanoarchaeia archaeon]|nr:hypothetical protein [Candidatus Nanoarchaeia archaeon]